MNSSLFWHRGLCLHLLLMVGAIVGVIAQAAPAYAQSPMYRNLDANGVDLTLGDYVMAFKEGSIGSGDGELALLRQNNGNYPSQWDGYTLQQTVSGGVTTVVVGFPGQKADKFIGGNPNSVTGNGATLTFGTDPTYAFSYVYTAPDGTKVLFINPWGNDGITTNFCISTGTFCSLVPATIARPNGASVSIAWRLWQQPNNFFTWRMTSVTSNYGYAIKFTYQTNPLGGGGGSYPPAGWYTRTVASFFNNNVSTTVPQATVGYAYPASDTVDITDMAGNAWEVTSTSVKRPGEASPSFTVGGTAGAVTSVTRDGITFGYSRAVSGTTATMTVTDPLSHSAVVTSDLTVGRPTSSADALGKTTSYSYDGSGRLTRVTAPEGNYTQYTLDSRGNALTTTHVAKSGSGLTNIVTTATYPSTCTNPLTCNKPTATTDALGNTTDYVYDGSTGLITSVTAPAASTGGIRPQTRYSYTTTSGVTLLTGVSTCQTTASCAGTADEIKTTIAYDANGNATSTSTSAGNGSLAATRTATFTPMGDVASIDGPLSGTADTALLRYDAARRLVGTISPDPDGAGPMKRRAMRTTYDAAGRVTKAESGTVNGTSDTDWAAFTSLQQSVPAYDANHRKISDTATAGGTTYGVKQYSYDAAGRIDCTALRMNSALWASLPSSACTAQTPGSAGADRISKATYDADNRLLKTTTAYGTTEQSDDGVVTYNDNGTRATLTDANGNKTSYSYDGFDRPLAVHYPTTTTGSGTSSPTDYEQVTYDAGSEVVSRRLRDGTSIGFSHDHLGRLTLKDLPASEYDVSYAYDLIGRPTSASTSIFSATFGYDALGRLISEGGPLGTVSAQFDAAGNRTRLTWPDGFYVSYDHLVTGEVAAIRENGAASGIGVLGSYSYDDLGRRTTLVRGNGTSTTYGYDGASRLSALTLDQSGTSSDLTLGFSYNPASQIAATTRSNDAYAWIGAANRNDASSVNGLNQATSMGAGSLSYDARGNLNSTGSSVYTYSSENLLLTGPSSASLIYDPLLRLYQESGASGTTLLQYNGQSLVGEYDPSGTLQKRYVHGPGADEVLVEYDRGTGGVYTRAWLHADERGSIVAQSNDTGATTATNAYDEYGVPASTNVGRFQYTGQAYMPELGMYYYKARIYSARLGRFLQTDPIGYGDGANWYGYVHGDPINGSDPGGLECTGSHISTATCEQTGATCYGMCGGQQPTPPKAAPAGEGGAGQSGRGTWVCNDCLGSTVEEQPDDVTVTANKSYTWVPSTGSYFSQLSQIPVSLSSFTKYLRLPDYIGTNINIAIPNPLTLTFVGLSGTASLDRYGNFYWSPIGVGVGKSATVVSGSLTANWMNQLNVPSRQEMNGMLTTHGFNATAGFWGGVSESWTPGTGTSTGVGFVSPQAGASYNYSFYGGHIINGW